MFKKVILYIRDTIPEYKYNESDFCICQYANGTSEIKMWNIQGIEKPTSEVLDTYDESNYVPDKTYTVEELLLQINELKTLVNSLTSN